MASYRSRVFSNTAMSYVTRRLYYFWVSVRLTACQTPRNICEFLLYLHHVVIIRSQYFYRPFFPHHIRNEHQLISDFRRGSRWSLRSSGSLTQCRVVIPCRRFGTTYRYHLRRSRIPGTSVRNNRYTCRTFSRRAHISPPVVYVLNKELEIDGLNTDICRHLTNVYTGLFASIQNTCCVRVFERRTF